MNNLVLPAAVLLDETTFSVAPNLDIVFVIGVFLMLFLTTLAVIQSLAAGH